MKLKNGYYRYSIDIAEDINTSLYEVSDGRISACIRELLQTFLTLNDYDRTEYLSLSQKLYENAGRRHMCGEYMTADHYIRELEKYNRLIRFFSNPIELERYELDEGAALLPKSWVICNEPTDRHYVCVIEFRNGDKKNLPHFAYFCKDLVKNYGRKKYEEINDLILRACEKEITKEVEKAIENFYKTIDNPVTGKKLLADEETVLPFYYQLPEDTASSVLSAAKIIRN